MGRYDQNIFNSFLNSWRKNDNTAKKKQVGTNTSTIIVKKSRPNLIIIYLFNYYILFTNLLLLLLLHDSWLSKKRSTCSFYRFVCYLLFFRTLLESFLLSNDHSVQSRLRNRWTAESKEKEFKKTKEINKIQLRNTEYLNVASLLLALPNKNITKFSPKIN